MRRFFLCLVLVWFVSPQAWGDDRIPAYLIRLPAQVKTVFVAETSAAEFHRFESIPGKPVEHQGHSYMSIGTDGVGKQRAGDQRTPLGIYFVTEQLDTSKLHEKYGITAFPLDYPNAWDERMERSGDGIWVHGVDARGGERPERDTDGCIALSNDKLAMLESLFKPNITPVIIAREVDWVSRKEVGALRVELENALATWSDSLRRGDLHTYLSLYDDDFRHWGMNKAEWTALRVETLGSRPIRNVTISDLLLIGDPEEDGLYLSRFRQSITEPNKTVKSTKRLYWRRSANGALRIVAEDAG